MPPQSKLPNDANNNGNSSSLIVKEGDVEWMDGGNPTVQDKIKKTRRLWKFRGEIMVKFGLIWKFN